MKYILLMVLVSCAGLTSQSPPRDKAHSFFELRPHDPNKVFKRVCSKQLGDDRKCHEQEFDLSDPSEWEFFSNGFILIKYDSVFP